MPKALENEHKRVSSCQTAGNWSRRASEWRSMRALKAGLANSRKRPAAFPIFVMHERLRRRNAS
jgi:hypothetical protein